eukprot:TRINITY_DN2892_c0_g1_i1.p1 TRINITY_DN2892_c0_g1~~TRINITY_DN2892_c0_g1_i1.p1  ORF type:complete len:110 (-),score=10.34 TRINITY_DN2892_c0_g1_i1:44-373(-)
MGDSCKRTEEWLYRFSSNSLWVKKLYFVLKGSSLRCFKSFQASKNKVKKWLMLSGGVLSTFSKPLADPRLEYESSTDSSSIGCPLHLSHTYGSFPFTDQLYRIESSGCQ